MRQQSLPSSYAQVLVQDWNDWDHIRTKQMLEHVHSQEQAWSALLEINKQQTELHTAQKKNS
jgi:hypothetical protein